MHRHIIHLHIPALPIAVARISRPELRERPVAVAAPRSGRSPILSVSREARNEGVFKGMPLGKAKKLCPGLTVLPPDPKVMKKACQNLTRSVARYTPLYQPSRPGHIYLDLTDTQRLWGKVKDTACHLRKEIRRRLCLTGTVGVAGNKMVSNIASRTIFSEGSPEGVLDVDHGREAGFMAPLRVGLIRALRKRRRGLIIFSDDFSLLKALKRDSMEDLFVEMSPGYQMGRCYAFSRKTGIPPLATNRVYMTRKGLFPLHRILRAVSLNTKLSRLTNEDTCREHNFLNTPRDMIDQYPHAPIAISNTVKVAESSLSDWDFDRIIFPSFEKLGAEEAFNQLYRATMDGCRVRYGRITRAVRERVAHEMEIIREKEFAPYFLVVSDITKRAGRSCGRGGTAASIVSYALGITHVDPIKHNLFFERFLNPGRIFPQGIPPILSYVEHNGSIYTERKGGRDFQRHKYNGKQGGIFGQNYLPC